MFQALYFQKIFPTDSNIVP